MKGRPDLARLAAYFADEARLLGYAPARLTGQTPDARGQLADLLTVRPPVPLPADIAEKLDELLASEGAARRVTDVATLPRIGEEIAQLRGPLTSASLWQGDITTLRAEAIVNAANRGMLGCFVPGHDCIDHAIHAAAGPKLRAECQTHMVAQGHPEPSGTAWVSGGYHLPARLVVHTVGPIVQGRVPGPRDEQALASCYTSCLDAAKAAGAHSIALCSISTGLFGYPIERAAPVALGAVETWLERRRCEMHIVFNTFSHGDTLVYRKALAEWSMR